MTSDSSDDARTDRGLRRWLAVGDLLALVTALLWAVGASSGLVTAAAAANLVFVFARCIVLLATSRTRQPSERLTLGIARRERA